MNLSSYFNPIQYLTHLRTPPPLTSLHLVIKSNGFIGIRIVSFGCEGKVLDMFRVTVECFEILDNIAHKKVILFPCNLNFMSRKCWPFWWKLGVDDFIELS